jgi:hypothetical protein
MLRTGKVASCFEHGDKHRNFLNSQGIRDTSRRALLQGLVPECPVIFIVLKNVFTFPSLKILNVKAISLLTYVYVSHFISSLFRQLLKVVIFLYDK